MSTRVDHGNRSGPRRGRRRRSAVLATVVVTLAVLAAACGPAAPPLGPAAPPDALTATLYHRTNADRASVGLGPLAWDARLAGLAGEWAQYLSDTRQFRHRDLAATIRSPGFEGYASLGENILVSPAAVGAHAMQNAWLASPRHHAVVMGNWDSVGIGVVHGHDGSVRAVANFGRHW